GGQDGVRFSMWVGPVDGADPVIRIPFILQGTALGQLVTDQSTVVIVVELFLVGEAGALMKAMPGDFTRSQPAMGIVLALFGFSRVVDSPDTRALPLQCCLGLPAGMSSDDGLRTAMHVVCVLLRVSIGKHPLHGLSISVVLHGFGARQLAVPVGAAAIRSEIKLQAGPALMSRLQLPDAAIGMARQGDIIDGGQTPVTVVVGARAGPGATRAAAAFHAQQYMLPSANGGFELCGLPGGIVHACDAG